MKFGLGQPVSRQEDDALLRGAGRYVGDIYFPDQSFAAVMRSSVAHGTITALEIEAARSAPGVLAVYTHAEIADQLKPLGNDFPLEPAPAPVTMPHLAGDRVHFVGQPIAFVVAESRAAAVDAAELIEVETEDLPVVTDPEVALEPGAPELHGEAPGNQAYAWECGDRAATEAAFARAAHIVTTRVLNQRIVVNSMEPRAITIRYLPEEERWEAWVGSQGAHGMRARIASSLGVEPSRLRVHAPDIGGGFGMKLMNHPEYALAALAARDLGRPVTWIGDRSESFLSDAQGRDMRGTIEGAFDSQGRCLAMRMRTVSGLGAYYSTFGAAIHTVFSAPLLGGMYKVPAIHAEVRGAFTNSTPTDAYRGAGRPETIYATERLIEQAARDLEIDRIEIRRRNLITPDLLPYKAAGGMTFDTLDAHAVLDRALENADYAAFEDRAEAAAAEGRAAGIGVAYYYERTGGAPVESTRVRVTPDGAVQVWIGTQTTGQGHATAWAQVLHERLGVDFDRIAVMPGDSDALSAAGGTGGSRSAKMASRVLIGASDSIVDQGRKLAAERLEAAERDIEFSPADGARFRIAGTDRSVGLVELAEGPGEIVGDGQVDTSASTFPNGCHIAEVEIDRATGVATLTRYTIVDDFGTMINPELVKGQVFGGVVQGLGQVFGEAAVWDGETGQPLTASYMDYQMPRAADLPSFDIAFHPVPAKTNPLGIKGCGEAGCCGGISAGALAVLDALHRAGAGPIETPYTPLRLWQALAAA